MFSRTRAILGFVAALTALSIPVRAYAQVTGPGRKLAPDGVRVDTTTDKWSGDTTIWIRTGESRSADGQFLLAFSFNEVADECGFIRIAAMWQHPVSARGARAAKALSSTTHLEFIASWPDGPRRGLDIPLSSGGLTKAGVISVLHRGILDESDARNLAGAQKVEMRLANLNFVWSTTNQRALRKLLDAIPSRC